MTDLGRTRTVTSLLRSSVWQDPGSPGAAAQPSLHVSGVPQPARELGAGSLSGR